MRANIIVFWRAVVLEQSSPRLKKFVRTNLQKKCLPRCNLAINNVRLKQKKSRSISLKY